MDPTNSSSCLLPSKFKLDWRTLPVDIIWDRVYSKFLNTWLVFIAMFLMLTFVSGNWIDNPFPENASSWMGDVVIYQLLLIVGTAATIVISPFMYANGHDQFHKPRSVFALSMFPIGCACIFTTFWVFKRDESREMFPLFFWLSALTGCTCCVFYFIHISILAKNKKSYMKKHQCRNERYVQRLLKGKRQLDRQPYDQDDKEKLATLSNATPIEHTVLETRLHPIYEEVHIDRQDEDSTLSSGLRLVHNKTRVVASLLHAHVFPDLEQDDPANCVPTEVSVQDFFFSLPQQWPIVLRDIRKNTPQLMILGTVLGAMAVGYIVGWTYHNMFIETKWEHLYDKFERSTEDLETYIDSVYALQDDIAVLADSKLFTRSVNYSSSVNDTYAKSQIEYYLHELGYNVTVNDIMQTVSAMANVTSSAEDTAQYFDQLSDAYSDFKAKIRGYKDEYNDLKWSWNASLILASTLGSLCSLASLAWPILVSSNTRRNLRTGKWRYNKSAYCSHYKVHSLTEVPGTIFGVAAVSHILLVLVLSLVFFLVIYSPVRDFIWKYFKKYFVSLLCAVAFKNILIYLLFTVWQLDKDGQIKNIESYSIVFIIILFFNVVYGPLGSILRLLLFFCYSFVANLRIDSTMLPIPAWRLDAAFSAYNAYLLYEHEYKNPIMRTALQAFGGSYGYSSVVCNEDSKMRILSHRQIRARTRWFLAYTLLHNPSLVPLRRRGRKDTAAAAVFTGASDGKRDVESGDSFGIVMSELHKT